MDADLSVQWDLRVILRQVLHNLGTCFLQIGHDRPIYFLFFPYAKDYIETLFMTLLRNLSVKRHVLLTGREFSRRGRRTTITTEYLCLIDTDTRTGRTVTPSTSSYPVTPVTRVHPRDLTTDPGPPPGSDNGVGRRKDVPGFVRLDLPT